MNFLKTSSRSDRIEATGVLAVWFVAAWPFLDPRTSVYGFDTLAYTAPNLSHVFDSWRHISIPLWQGEVFGGVPFLGRMGSQALYLPHLPLMFLNLNTALDLGAAIHLLILATGIHAFVRGALRMPPPAGLVATSALLGSSYLLVKMLSYDQLVAMAWLPWLLLTIEIILRHPTRLSHAGPFALVASLLIVGGHPQYIYLEAITAALYLLFRLVESTSWIAIRTVCLGSVLALGMTALQLAATYFLSKSSGIPTKRSLVSLYNPAYILPPSRIPLGVLGDIFSRNPTMSTGSGEAILGIGVPICLLAIIGLVFGFHFGAASRLGMALSALVGTILSVGPRWSIFRLFYQVVPGFGGARVPGRWLILPLVFGTLLAADGISVLYQTSRRLMTTGATVAVSVASAAMILFGPFEIPPTSLVAWWAISSSTACIALAIGPSSRRRYVIHAWVLIFVFVGALIPLLHSPARESEQRLRFDEIPAPLVEKIRKEGGRVFAQTFDVFNDPSYLLRNLRPNVGIISNVPTVDGYDGGQWVQRRWISLSEVLIRKRFSTDLTIRSQTDFPITASIMRRLGVRWVLIDSSVLPANQQVSGFKGPVETSGHVELWENPLWSGDALAYTRSVIRRPNLGSQLKALSQDEVVVENDDELVTCDGNCSVQGVSQLFQEDGRAAFVFEIASDGILAFNQGWSRDWMAYVDGVRAKTFPVNGNQIGVQFSAGFHRVEFRYAPRWVQPLIMLGVFATLITLALCLEAARSKNRTLFSGRLGANQQSPPIHL